MSDEIGNNYGIAEQKTFVDTKGRRVVQFVEVFGKDKGKFVLRGAAMVNARTPDPRVPMRQIPFEFEFPAGTTVKDAFAMFDSEAEKVVEKMQQQQAEQSRIVSAKAMPKILGMDGKPVPVG